MLKLYTIDTNYVDFMRADPNLSHVWHNEKNEDSFARKYIGVVLEIGSIKYYAPLSSPKNSDYQLINGERRIRKSIIPIIRIVVEENGKKELKGTIRLSSMIPVSDEVIVPYEISEERDENYRDLVEKEYEFIRQHENEIKKRAELLYHQKNKENTISSPPGYLQSTIDFKLAEARCKLYPPSP